MGDDGIMLAKKNAARMSPGNQGAGAKMANESETVRLTELASCAG